MDTLSRTVTLMLCWIPSLVWAISDDSWVVAVGAGPAWYQAGKTQTLHLQSDLYNTYVAQKTSPTLAIGEGFLGLQHRLNSQLLGQVGVSASVTSPASLRGEIWETADPEFNNFTYRYDVRQTRVSLKGKLLSEKLSKMWLPYLSGSVGIGWNKSYHFSSTSVLFEAISAPQFQPKTQTVFTYTVGVGVLKQLSKHWQTGIGYELSDWGQSSLSRAPGQLFGTGLQLNHLLSHQLQLTMSYLS